MKPEANRRSHLDQPWGSAEWKLAGHIVRCLVGMDDERWESTKRLKAWLKEIRDSEQGSEIKPVG